MKSVRIAIVSLLIVLLLSASSEAGWLIYHKPEFTGKVIDAETKQPIEGAVVVVVYNKSAMSLGAGQLSSIIHVREALTDKEGVFHIPSYTTIIQPFSWSSAASYIIFKPGYGNFPNQNAYPPALSLPDQEIFFSTGIGSEKMLKAQIGDWKYEYRTLKMGIVELPKVKTKAEREKARMYADIFGADVKEGELPILYKVIKEERQGGF